jgi:arsenite methyltransferase
LYLADLVGPAGMVLGLDPLPHRIEFAREKTRSNLSFDVGDANNLSMLAQLSFDVVVLNAVFHWLPEKTGPLRQFAHLLCSGGRLGISTGLKGYRTPLQEAMMATLHEPPFHTHSQERESIVFRVDAVDMRVLFEAAGFTPARLEVVETEQHFPSAETALRFSIQVTAIVVGVSVLRIEPNCRVIVLNGPIDLALFSVRKAHGCYRRSQEGRSMIAAE